MSVKVYEKSFRLFENNYSDFMDDLLKNRDIYEKLAALVLKTQEFAVGDRKEMKEILQVIEFQFIGHDIWLLTCDSNCRIFLVLKNNKVKALSFLETAIRSEFSEDQIRIELSVPLSTGHEKFCNILKSSIPKNDNKSNTSLKRFERTTKTFIIHSSDTAVRADLTQILQSFGNVIGTSTSEDFIKNYREYAPNAVFVDSKDYVADKNISFPTVKTNIDPHPKYVIISKKSRENHVVSFLNEGVSGFLLYPTSFGPVFSQLSRLKILTSNVKNISYRI